MAAAALELVKAQTANIRKHKISSPLCRELPQHGWAAGLGLLRLLTSPAALQGALPAAESSQPPPTHLLFRVAALQARIASRLRGGCRLWGDIDTIGATAENCKEEREGGISSAGVQAAL